MLGSTSSRYVRRHTRADELRGPNLSVVRYQSGCRNSNLFALMCYSS